MTQGCSFTQLATTAVQKTTDGTPLLADQKAQEGQDLAHYLSHILWDFAIFIQLQCPQKTQQPPPGAPLPVRKEATSVLMVS